MVWCVGFFKGKIKDQKVLLGGETFTTPTFQLGSTVSTPVGNIFIKPLCISEVCSHCSPFFAFIYIKYDKDPVTKGLKHFETSRK